MSLRVLRLGVAGLISSDSFIADSKATVLALGSFDGIHQGHLTLVDRIVHLARKSAAPDLFSGVLGFYPHPRNVLANRKPSEKPNSEARSQFPRISDVRENTEILDARGVDYLFMARFTRDFSLLSASEFVQRILVDALRCKQLVVGPDASFGAGREGDLPWMRQRLASFGIELIEAQPVCGPHGGKISSSAIRAALEKGEVDLVSHLLGRPFSRSGRIIPGKQLARTIGFPTLNVPLRSSEIVPRFGVYAGFCKTGNVTQPAIANVGIRPTVYAESTVPLLEVHLLGDSPSLPASGDRLRFVFDSFLRPEQKFASLEQLQEQIAMDCQQARTLLAKLKEPTSDETGGA